MLPMMKKLQLLLLIGTIFSGLTVATVIQAQQPGGLQPKFSADIKRDVAAFVQGADDASSQNTLQTNLLDLIKRTGTETRILAQIVSEAINTATQTPGQSINKVGRVIQIATYSTVSGALGAETSLRAEQIQLHNQLMRSAPQQVDSLIAAEFPPNCTILGGSFHYCLNRGVFGNRKSNVERHFNNKSANSTKCNASQHLKAGGQILVGIHGIKCPQAVVELVRKKQFKLPYHHAAANESNPNPNPTPIIASTPSSRRHRSKFAQFYFL